MLTLTPDETQVGFIGTGIMGQSMARHLMNAGYRVHLYTRTKAKAESLLAEGAEWHDSPRDLAGKCNVVITMVGFPSDVEEVYLGEHGLITHCQLGTYVIDMTTSSPILARRIYEAAKARQLHALDAPVSGGDIGAREARLTIMVGGDQQAFKQVHPLLEKLGNNVVLQGAAGAGQHTKMSNQITIASNMIGVCEAILYARSAGLDPETVLESISTGAAGSSALTHLAPRIIAGNFEPGFYVKHFIKDMDIALEAAKEMGIQLPGVSLARQLYQRAADSGLGDKGTQVLYTIMSQS